MAQHVYDDPRFFAGYARLPRSIGGLEAAPEWPSLRAMLPELRGKRVLDLGCGYGWFCRWAREQGAAAVLGIDVSEKMLARAQADTGDPGIVYRLGDLETVELGTEQYDLVYSSLAFHYVGALPRLLHEIHRALAHGGVLVFSTEHPIYTAPPQPRWSTDAVGNKEWPVSRYLEEGPREPEWLGARVRKHHRTLGTWVNSLIAAGFSLQRLEEWRPTDRQIAAQPDLADERHRPIFLLIAARK
jgi:SAM-dependent methyltransferase